MNHLKQQNPYQANLNFKIQIKENQNALILSLLNDFKWQHNGGDYHII